jgi:hypothetical protein
MAFDLNDLSGLSDAQEAGIDVSITHPKTGEPLGMVVNVSGPDSKKQAKARTAVLNDRVEKKIRKITAGRLTEEANSMVANSINSWSGCVIESKTIEYTVDNAVMVFTRWPFIREQVQSVSDDRANFIKT